MDIKTVIAGLSKITEAAVSEITRLKAERDVLKADREKGAIDYCNLMARYDGATNALRLALRVMRGRLWDDFNDITLGFPTSDVFTEFTPDIAAIRAATAIVGPQPDMEGVDTAWLNAAIEAAPKGEEG